MQPQSQPQTPSQPPSFPLNLRQLASADVVDMQAKLKQVEIRITELRKKQIEAAQAGRTEDANKYGLILAQQTAAYRKGCEFVMRVVQTKRAVAAAQAQGSSQPQEPVPDPSPSQHPTPAVSVTPQATPPTTSHSTPRLATPRKPGIQLNQNPMSAANQLSPNMNPNSGAGPVANSNAQLLQAFNPAATQIPPQVGLGGPSAPVHDAHVLSATPQHGHSHHNNLGQQLPQMPPDVAAQMKKLIEQRGLAQGNPGLIMGGNSAGAGLTAAGGFGERIDNQWTGTLMWQGTDTTRNEKKEVRAQVTATASKGNPCALFPMEFLSIEDSRFRTHLDWHQRGQRSCRLHLLAQRCHWRSSKIGSGRTTLC